MSTQTQIEKNGYLLMIRSDEWYNHLSADELQKLMQQAKEWFERLIDQGKAKPGQALAREGATVFGKTGRVVIDGPYAESKEAIGGFVVLQADTLEEAIAAAKSNPLVPYGASIEIRPVAAECPLDARARELAEEAQLATA
jgi:hypothetical protein